MVSDKPTVHVGTHVVDGRMRPYVRAQGASHEPYPPDATAMEELKHLIAKKVDGMHPSSLGQRVAMENSMLINWFRHANSQDSEERLEAWKEQWDQ